MVKSKCNVYGFRWFNHLRTDDEIPVKIFISTVADDEILVKIPISTVADDKILVIRSTYI